MKHTVYDNFLGTSCSFIWGLYSVGKIQHAVTLINPSVPPKKQLIEMPSVSYFLEIKRADTRKDVTSPSLRPLQLRKRQAIYI
jgi:hypothetical protein